MSRALDFIYVGTPKAGSTWLFEALREHPEARLLGSKSSTFFEKDHAGPLEDYLRLLDRLEPGGMAGEISHDAYIRADTAERLRAAFPDVKILLCLREPGDFAQSMLQWLATHTDVYGRDATQITANPYIRDALDFPGRLAPFLAAFPAEQVKVLFFDDLAADPRGFYRDICRFIGLSPEFEPSVLTQVVNPARPPRFAGLNYGIFNLGRLVRNAGLGSLVERAKRWRWVEALLYSSAKRDVPPQISAAAAQAREAARPGLDRLEAMLDRPLPPAWRKA